MVHRKGSIILDGTCKLRFILCLLAGLIISNITVSIALAESWNIFDKGRSKMNTNQEEREVIRLIKEKFQRETGDIAWSTDGKWIATTGVSRQVVIWDAASLSIRHQMEQTGKGYGSDNITFSPDSRYVASGSGIIDVWGVADGSHHMTLIAPHITPGIPQNVGVRSLRFRPDGKMLVVIYDGETQMVIAYRTADGKIAWSYEPKRFLEPERKGSPSITTPLVFTPDGKKVILGTQERGSDDLNLKMLTRILALDADTGTHLGSIDDVHVEGPTALTVSIDGKWLATGTDTGSKRQTRNRKTRRFVSIDNKDPVRIWSLETGKLAKELPVLCRVRHLAFSRDGKYLFGAIDEAKNHLALVVWDVESGKIVQKVVSKPLPVALAISPDGRRLATAREAGISIYEITGGD